jgi:hypothetical protein
MYIQDLGPRVWAAWSSDAWGVCRARELEGGIVWLKEGQEGVDMHCGAWNE